MGKVYELVNCLISTILLCKGSSIGTSVDDLKRICKITVDKLNSALLVPDDTNLLFSKHSLTTYILKSIMELNNKA